MTGAHRVTIGANRIGYEDPIGSGTDAPPVLLIHGSSVHRAIWDPVVDTLRDEFRPISIDHPGHGDSSLPACASVEALTELIGRFCTQLELSRLVLIGFSLGGAVAQLFHQRHRDKLAGLGLISTAPNFALPDELVARWRADPAGYAKDELSLSLAPMASTAARDRVIALRGGVTAEGQAADLEACAAWDGPPGLDGIACPVLAMTASDDIPGLKRQAEQWARDLPGSRLVEIADAGHFMLVEQPVASAAAIREWLLSLEISG